MSKFVVKALVFSAIAAVTVGFASAVSATTLAGASGARLDTTSQTETLVIPVARRGGFHGYRGGYHGYRRFYGYRGHRGYYGYRGRHGYRGYYGYRGRYGYRGYYGYPGPYWGYRGYWGPNIYVAPYYYGDYDDVPRYYNAPPAAGSCAYWSRQCVKNWGYGNSNYRGCMRYQGCAPR